MNEKEVMNLLVSIESSLRSISTIITLLFIFALIGFVVNACVNFLTVPIPATTF